jgi:surface antigen
MASFIHRRGFDMRSKTATVSGIVAALVIAWSAPAAADPPAHAPAHGWRAKQAGRVPYARHVGHSGATWEADFGILSGNCNRQEIATVVGGITGGLIANRVADSDNRTVATLIGAAAGAFIGNRVGKRLDDADEACIGHALELGKTGQTVNWSNEATGVAYQLIPGADRERNGSQCREFSLRMTDSGRRSRENGLACQSARGVWEIVQ